MAEKQKPNVGVDYVLKIEGLCKEIVHQLERGEKKANHELLLVMMIFGSTYNKDYRERLFKVWPDYLADMSALEYKYPEILCEELEKLNLGKDVSIIDMACGPGNVGVLLNKHGYKNVEGLEPSPHFADQAKETGTYKDVTVAFVKPDEETPLPANKFDVLLCSAGMFPGAIEPQAFPEFIRVVKPGGYMMWNVANNYKSFNKFFAEYDNIMEDLVKSGKWKEVCKPKLVENLLFSDAGYFFCMQKC